MTFDFGENEKNKWILDLFYTNFTKQTETNFEIDKDFQNLQSPLNILTSNLKTLITKKNVISFDGKLSKKGKEGLIFKVKKINCGDQIFTEEEIKFEDEEKTHQGGDIRQEFDQMKRDRNRRIIKHGIIAFVFITVISLSLTFILTSQKKKQKKKIKLKKNCFIIKKIKKNTNLISFIL